jgi:hypothetical protein
LTGKRGCWTKCEYCHPRTVEVAVTAKIETSSHVGRVLGQAEYTVVQVRCSGDSKVIVQTSTSLLFVGRCLFVHVLHSTAAANSVVKLGRRGSRHNDGFGALFLAPLRMLLSDGVCCDMALVLLLRQYGAVTAVAAP